MRGEKLELDLDLYPLDAVYAAAYASLDRAWVYLERTGERVTVTVRSKRDGVSDHAALGQLGNELVGCALRQLLTTENRRVVEVVITRAIGGAAGPPGLDELLEVDIGDATAFEDPLGIAMSWEEKYGKKEKPGTEGGGSEGGEGA